MKTTIKAKTRITKRGFVGFVTVYENGRYLWQESSGITRIDCIDALEDANQVKENILSIIA